MENVYLEEFAGGALQEKFNDALQKVIENMLDPNTPWKNKREIIVKVAFLQDEGRSDSSVDISVATKLAPVKPVNTRMLIGKNLKTGDTYAEEYGSQCKGQMSLKDCMPKEDEQEAVIDNQMVDMETGEVVEKVVNFRAKA